METTFKETLQILKKKKKNLSNYGYAYIYQPVQPC